MDEKDKKFNLRKSFFESIKSAFNSKTNLKENILKVGKDIEKNENTLENNQNINILENIKRDFELEKDLLKKLADKSIKEIKQMYIAKIDKLEIKIEELKSEYSALREEKLLLIDKFEKELANKDNIIFDSGISKNKELSENLEKTKIQLNNSNKIKKILEDDLNKVVKEKNNNYEQYKKEISQLKGKLQRSQFVNNDLMSENQLLLKKINTYNNNGIKFVDKTSHQNSKDFKLTSKNNYEDQISFINDSFIDKFKDWLNKSYNASQGQKRRIFSDLKRVRIDLIEIKNIDIFNHKFTNLYEIIDLKNKWSRIFKSQDKNNNLSSAFNRFIEFNKVTYNLSNFSKVNIVEIAKKDQELNIPNSFNKITPDANISELNFTIRVYHALMRKGYKKLNDIRKLTDSEILSIKNLGDTGLQEIRNNISKYDQLYKKSLDNNIDNSNQLYKKNNLGQDSNKELFNVNIKNRSNKILKPEIIKPIETKFTYSKEKALNERKKDQRIRSKLAEIFKDQIEDNNESAVMPDNNINLIDAKLKSALDLICTNINADFEVDKSIFFEIAKHFNVTFNVLIDEINEHLYDKYDFLLIEIEDEIAYIDEECLSLLKKEIEND